MSGDTEVLVRNLDDSYVLITGGTSGIGFASAQKFAESGSPKISIDFCMYVGLACHSADERLAK